MHEGAPIAGTMYCRRCAYILNGLPECHCPECGLRFDLTDRATYRTANSTSWQIRRAAHGAVLPCVFLALWLFWASATPPFTPNRGNNKVFLVKAKISPAGPLALALELYRKDNGDYPPALDALVRRPPSVQPGQWTNGPYLSNPEALFDPWLDRFRYVRRSRGGAKYRLWSTGPDGVNCTCDDIIN